MYLDIVNFCMFSCSHLCLAAYLFIEMTRKCESRIKGDEVKVRLLSNE